MAPKPVAGPLTASDVPQYSQAALDRALAAEQERIRAAAREAAFTLFRPGNGPAHGQSIEVVPLGEMLAILGEEGTGA